jgi:hypothetical protein
MNDPHPDDTGAHDSLRRLLKELPRVDASADFEQRLARRIREAAPAPAPRRRSAIPVFATSLAALLVTGLISYYTFFRVTDPVTTLPPATVPPASTQPPENVPPAAPSDRGASSDAAAKVSPPASEVKTQPRELPSRSAPVERRSEDRGVAPAEERKDVAPAAAAPEEKLIEQERGLIQQERQAEPAAVPSEPLDALKKAVLPAPSLQNLTRPQRLGRQETLGSPLMQSGEAAMSVAPADTTVKKDTTSVDTLRKVRPVPSPQRKEKRRRPRP